MTFPSGKRVGIYEISTLIGKGGMGHVYRALDTRLRRAVAIKILPSQFSSDAVRLSRFEKEARSASALNHPNIITIHEIGQTDGISYIVMELVEGKTLRETLLAGPLPVLKVIEIGAQISDGLAKAHAAGIIHRDLKPENVMINKDGFVKILDFGLAKLFHDKDLIQEETQAPTMSVTQPGLILGTVGYMSPEQATAGEIDFRSDQFSLGSILYELTTARAPFQRGSTIATLSAIIQEEPQPIVSFAQSAPAPLRWIIERCLSKDPEGRYASTKDLARDLAALRAHLSEVSTSGDLQPVVGAGKVSSPVRSARLAWALTGIATLLLIAGALYFMRRSIKPVPTVQFLVSPPAGVTFNFVGRDAGPVIVSPDGSRLAYVGTTREGRKQIFIRRLDSVLARALEGTDGATYPFWSPDSRFLGFFAEGRLKKIGAEGGPPQTLCDATAGRGGTWNKEGIIVFSPGIYDALYRVSSNGGPVTAITRIGKDSDELSHRWPNFLPDQRHVLYLGFRQIVVGQKGAHRVYITSLDGKKTTLLPMDARSPVLGVPGYLLFVREANLLAQPFDAKKFELTGEVIPVAQQVQAYLNTGSAVFSSSQNGVLAYQSSAVPAISQLKWFDRSGQQLGTLGPPGDYEDPDISPDGKRVAINRIDSQIGTTNIWFFEVNENKATRFTFSGSFDHHAVWVTDQSKIIFNFNRHEFSIRREIKNLFAVTTPFGLRSTAS